MHAKMGTVPMRGPSLSTVLSKGRQLRPDLFLFYFKASASGNANAAMPLRLALRTAPPEG